MKAYAAFMVVFVVIATIVVFFSYQTKEFEYHDHEYIQFSKGVVHNPDCKYCLSKYD